MAPQQHPLLETPDWQLAEGLREIVGLSAAQVDATLPVVRAWLQTYASVPYTTDALGNAIDELDEVIDA